MQTKHLCVLFHIRTKGDGTVKLFKPCSKIVFLTVPRRCFSCGSFLLFMLRACHAFLSVHCSLVGTCLEMANLLVCLYVKLFCVLSISHVVPLVRSILIYDLCLLTFFHLATQCVQSIPDDYACEGFRQYIDKGKEQKVYWFGECYNQSNIVPQNSCYGF